MGVTQLPTLPGKVDGIVGLDPVVLQCRKCGATATRDGERALWRLVVLEGWKFHTCEPGRHCPDCLAEALLACPRRHD